MRAIVDQLNNIVLVAESAKDQQYIENIPDVSVTFKGAQRNPQTNRMDYIIVLKPEVRENKTDTEVIEISSVVEPSLVALEEKAQAILTKLEEELEERKKTVRLLDANIEWQLGNMKKISEKKKIKSDGLDPKNDVIKSDTPDPSEQSKV